MEIANYENTHLALVEEWLQQDDHATDRASLKYILQEGHLSFGVEGISRLESMLLCELKDSYVQQSQRYVVMSQEGYILPKLKAPDQARAEALIQEALALYAEMSTLKEAYKGRPRKAHYLYGIPVEDARYILPLLMKTNITVSMSADKLFDLFKLFHHPNYGVLFEEFHQKLRFCLPPTLGKVLDEQVGEYGDECLVGAFYKEKLTALSPKEPVQLISSFTEMDLKAGLGAVTSTMSKPPSEVLSGWGEEASVKAQAVAKRVIGYGHTSIAEQARTTFGMMFSLVTYHQQVRHRLTKNYREPLKAIIAEEDRPVVMPPTIRGSAFEERFLALVVAFKAFRSHLSAEYDHGQQWYFLLNCDQIKVLIASNARMDQEMLSERICFNAQWEIRALSHAKLLQLRSLSPILYEKALPSCVYGSCKEGAYSCGRAKEMRAIYKAEQ